MDLIKAGVGVVLFLVGAFQMYIGYRKAAPPSSYLFRFYTDYDHRKFFFGVGFFMWLFGVLLVVDGIRSLWR